jgi:hypothetical protein
MHVGSGAGGARMMGRRKDGTLFSLRIAITESVVCETQRLVARLLERK